jgi:hypothetical protein
MSSETADLSKKRFMVFVYEIRQEIVWAEELSPEDSSRTMLAIHTRGVSSRI